MADQVVSYAVTGKDDGAAAMFTNVGAAVERVEKKVKGADASIEKLSEQVDKYVRNAEKISRNNEQAAIGFSRMSDVSKIALGNLYAMGSAKAIGWMKDLVAGTYEAVNKFQDLSDTLGVSTDMIQLYSAWAEQSGTSVDAVAKAVGKLEMEISKGNPELRKFGITALDGKEAFLQVVAAMDNAETQTEKVRIANAAFGKGWQEIMPVLKQGSENLGSIAANTALIDSKTIKAITDADDALARMKGNARALAAELIAAFGPITSEALEYWAGKLKALHAFMGGESDLDFARRIGATKKTYSRAGTTGEKIVFDENIDYDKLSSDDLYRLQDMKVNGANPLVSWGDPKKLRLHERYKKAKEREAAAAKKDAEEQAKKLAEQQKAYYRSKGLNDDGSPKEKGKDETPDYQALSDAAWLRAHGSSSPDTDEQVASDRIKLGWAPSSEVDYDEMWLKANGYSGPDTDQAAWWGRKSLAFGRGVYGEAPEWRKGNTSEKKWRAQSGMIRAGLVDENTGVGVFDSTQMSIEEMEAALKNAEDGMQDFKDSSIDAAEEIKQAFLDVAHSGIQQISGDLAHMLVQGELTAKNISTAFINMAENAMERVLQKFIEMQIEMAIIAAFTGGSSEGGGFITSMFKHADGTLNSQGGIGTLSERGIERVITPQGSDAYVTPGIYAMSPGARVIPAGNASAPVQHFSFVIQQYGGDPAQNAEQIRRIAREEASRANASNARTRFAA